MATTVDRDTHGCLRIISDDWGTMIVPEAEIESLVSQITLLADKENPA